jgi:small subunit ribosomal protein S6
VRDYELTVLLSPTVSEKELDKEAKKLQELFLRNKGKVKKNSDPAKRNLAYEIGHQNQAYYLYFELSVPAEGVTTIEGDLTRDDQVIRYLLVKKE